MSAGASDVPGDLGNPNPLGTWLNRLRRAVRKRTLLPGLGYKVRYSEGGTVLEIIPGAGRRPEETAPIERFVVTTVRGDYYLCHRPTDSTVVYIARPSKLRKSIGSEIIGGNTITYSYVSEVSRVATFSTFFESQIVVPWHLTGDHIYAAKPDGGTGVVTAAPDIVGDAVEWIDLNVDGRAWALAFQG